MRIETPRLILRPLSPEDAPSLAQATHETWEDLSLWMRWATDQTTLTDVENCKRYARDCLDKFRSGKDYTFAGFLKENKDFALIVRLAHLNPQTAHYQFGGYWCRKMYQGQGYMTEAVNAVLRYANAELGAHHFQITHAAGNIKSRSVIDKLGFTHKETSAKTHKLPDGTMVDEHILTLDSTNKLPHIHVSWT